MNNESVGKKIVEALKKQAENMDMESSIDNSLFEDSVIEQNLEDTFTTSNDDFFAEPVSASNSDFFNDVEESNESLFAEPQIPTSIIENTIDSFEMPANIAVLKKLISQLPSGVSRHTGAQIIKQTLEAMGIPMNSVLKEAQVFQEELNSSTRECMVKIQEYKTQIMQLEASVQDYQQNITQVNDIVSLFLLADK